MSSSARLVDGCGWCGSMLQVARLEKPEELILATGPPNQLM